MTTTDHPEYADRLQAAREFEAAVERELAANSQRGSRPHEPIEHVTFERADDPTYLTVHYRIGMTATCSPTIVAELAEQAGQHFHLDVNARWWLIGPGHRLATGTCDDGIEVVSNLPSYIAHHPIGAATGTLVLRGERIGSWDCYDLYSLYSENSHLFYAIAEREQADPLRNRAPAHQIVALSARELVAEIERELEPM